MKGDACLKPRQRALLCRGMLSPRNTIDLCNRPNTESQCSRSPFLVIHYDSVLMGGLLLACHEYQACPAGHINVARAIAPTQEQVVHIKSTLLSQFIVLKNYKWARTMVLGWPTPEN